MDRWYGPRGLRPDDPENAAYVFTGAKGLEPLAEIAPTHEEVADGWFYHGKHLDMFWTFNPNGTSYLDEKLKALEIDTIVIVGLWDGRVHPRHRLRGKRPWLRRRGREGCRCYGDGTS
jgi:hypothetical protein